MYGAILGDIIGSPYEFDQGGKTKDFPLFSAASEYTDDSVMTLAVAQAFMNAGTAASDDEIRKNMIASMQSLGRAFPFAGYGGMFIRWLGSSAPQAVWQFRQRLGNACVFRCMVF